LPEKYRPSTLLRLVSHYRTCSSDYCVPDERQRDSNHINLTAVPVTNTTTIPPFPAGMLIS
jgi:hypothetical protein